jgi:hypothetical protein
VRGISPRDVCDQSVENDQPVAFVREDHIARGLKRIAAPFLRRATAC